MDEVLNISKKNKKYSIINGSFSIAATSMVMNFLPIYAIQVLNATYQQIGLINSLPAITSLFATLVGGIWLNRLEYKKYFCGFSILAARLFMLLLSFIPFIPYYQGWLLVIIVGLMNIPGAFANLSWQSLIGDLIPEADRGNFFGVRNRINTFIGMTVIALVGLIINNYEKSNPYPYQVLIIISFILGLIEVYFLFLHIEKPIVKNKENKSFIQFWRDIKLIFQYNSFKYFLVSSIIFNFGWQMAWPIFNIYQIEFAHASPFWLSMFAVANQISQIIIFSWWGKIADQYGNLIMLFITSVGMASAPFLTVLSTNLYYLTILNLWTGLFLAGTNLLLFNQLLSVSPEEKRSSTITLYTVIIALIGFIAPQFGVWLLGKLGIYFTMNFSSIIRLLGAFSFLYIAVKLDYKRTKKIIEKLTNFVQIQK